jgi:hypothetical protein
MTLLTQIPFTGFYESWYSREIDHLEEMEIENQLERQKYEDKTPEHLTLDGPEFGELFYRASDYSAMYHAIARTYADGFNTFASEFCGFDLGLKFESMSSPREYNFSTDRIFCHIPRASVARLFRASKRDGHKALAREIREHFTSRSGFMSFYPNTLERWLDKRLSEWDWNELETLLCAVMSLSEDFDADEWEMDLFNKLTDCDGFYSEWSNGVDWEKFDASLAELRAEKLETWTEENPDLAAIEPAYRCPFTRDFFTGKSDSELNAN